MKPFISLICLFFVNCFSFAQLPDAVISGKANPAEHYLEYFSENKSWIFLSADSIRIASDGSFLQRLKLSEPAMVYMRYGGTKRLQFWMRPGDNLQIDVSGATPVLAGSAEIFASYFLKDQKIWLETYNAYQQKYPGFDKDPQVFTDRYFSIQDSITSRRINYLTEHFTNFSNNATREFIEHESASLIYSNLFYKLAFEGVDVEKFRFFQKKYKIKAAEAYGFSEQIAFKDAKLINNAAYRKFINALINTIVRKRINETGQEFSRDLSFDLGLKLIDELTEDSAGSVDLKVVFLDNAVNDLNRYKELQAANKLYDKLSLLDSNHSSYASLIRKKLDGIVTDTRFNTGKPAADFGFKNLDNLMYRLKDFKGKKIYIDIGASWCGPCIEGIPAWNKLVEQNAGNDGVVFVSLSIDDNETSWKDFLKKRTVKGLQLFAGTGGFKSEFATDYNITAIPHFLLIDEEGKILDYNAPRPESEEILRLLKKAN